MKVASVFPGQGAQRVGMGVEAYKIYPVVRETFQEASEVLGFDLARLCFEGPQEELTLTENAQPAILTLSVALYRVLEGVGFRPHIVAGHSLGEYSALVAAGGLPLARAVEAVRYRGRFMQEAVPHGRGAMAAIIGMDPQRVADLCQEFSSRGVVEVANYNSPEQTVISGEKEPVEAAAQAATQWGAKRAILLEVSAPFHSSLMAPAREKLRPLLEAMPFSDLAFPLVSNVTAEPVTKGDEERRLLLDQVTAPVLWTQSVRFIVDQGVQLFVEVGPGNVLSGLVRKIERRVKTVPVADPKGVEKLRGMGVLDG